jgi:two-component system CitB family response regulator/CitB family two-component system response regulator MalR
MINVLIVEDDPMVALINRRYLEMIGNIKIYGPVITEEEIIINLTNEKIDLVLLDIYLPKKSGLDILKSLRDKKYLVDVIMITAANSVEELKRAFAYGATDYLVKPFEFPRFQEAFKKYRNKHDILLNDGTVNQEDIDSINNLNDKEKELNLPKGLNKRTLDKLTMFLNENANEIWTLREIASSISISNVTVKKYMDYLEEIKKVNVKLTCGNVGRPELKYTIRNQDNIN